MAIRAQKGSTDSIFSPSQAIFWIASWTGRQIKEGGQKGKKDSNSTLKQIAMQNEEKATDGDNCCDRSTRPPLL